MKNKEELGMYHETDEEERYFDYLEEKSKNPVRRWYHSMRFRVARELINKYYTEGMTIIDLGCGSCNWNKDKLPVIGIDSSRKVLDYALKKQRIMRGYVRNANSTGLRSGSASLVVLFGLLEHVRDYSSILAEAYRLLKPNGIIISTVPYDTIFSLWKPLFGLHCFFQGHILGKPYFKKKAGHINQFSPRKMVQIYKKAGFTVVEQFNRARMEIYTVGRR